MSSPIISPHDRLLNVATKLFAELGYDQTTKEMIASAAGLPVTSIIEEFGDKRRLYLEVFLHIQFSERALLKHLAGGEVDRRGYHRFIDAYLDYLGECPEHAALWLQRWLNDAADLQEIEKDYVLPQFGEVVRLTAHLQDETIDTELLAWTVVWACQIFTLNGIPGHGDRRDSRDIARFRRHIHSMVDLCRKH